MERQAWMVRAGSNGEREGASREDGRAYVGWAEVSDLTGVESLSEVRDLIDRTYDDETASTRGNWAGQLYRFCIEMQKGDIVTTPLKSDANQMLIGRISGDYAYDASAAPDFRHYRDVKWNDRPLDRSTMRHDLRASTGSLLTVTKLERNNAFARLEKLSNGASRDEYGPAGKYSSLDELANAFRKRELEGEFQIPVHELLYLAGIQRRTAGTLSNLQSQLEQLDLSVAENVGELNLEDSVTIAQERATDGRRDHAEQTSSQRVIGYKVSAIPSATTLPVSVSTNDSLELALTRMIQDNFSQLPVIDQGAPKGAITWESIALATIHKKPTKVVDAMLPSPHIISLDTDLLDVVGLINSRGFILTSGLEDSIGGIITVEDLVTEFGRDTHPLALLEEVELRLRESISRKCTDDDVRKSSAKSNTISRLTMGNYPYLLEEDDIWAKLGWGGVDRGLLIDLVKKCGQVRNDLMHFSPDPIGADEISAIERTLRVIRTLTSDV